MALIFDDIEMSTPFPPELLLQCIVPSRHLVDGKLTIVPAQHCVDEKSLITKLPRPLLGKVLEFVGEKRPVDLTGITEGVVLTVIRKGPDRIVHILRGGCWHRCHTLFDSYDVLRAPMGATAAFNAIDIIRDNIDISHPRPNKYAN